MMVYRALMVYCAETLEGEVAALADITVTAHEHTLAYLRGFRGAHDVICERVIVTVHTVELRLGDAVIHFDGWEEQLPFTTQAPKR